MPNLFEAVKRSNYAPGDYILIDDQGEDVAVSGNAEFDDLEGMVMPESYIVVFIEEVSNV